MFFLALIFSQVSTNQNITLENPSSTIESFNYFQIIILGMIQGLTEFLPISSTAHLQIIPSYLGWGDPGVNFSAVIQLGSIISVVWYFWSDLKKIIMGTFIAIKDHDLESHDLRMGFGIFMGTLPFLLIGYLTKTFMTDMDNSILRSSEMVAASSIIMSLLLALAEKVGKYERTFDKLKWQDAFLMGTIQSLAIIPGVSRSGSTITLGLFLNLNRETAARFSFLIGIPAITIVGLYELIEIFNTGFSQETILPLFTAILSSIFFSYLSIAWLINYLQKQSTWIFVWYRLGFGSFILIDMFLS